MSFTVRPSSSEKEPFRVNLTATSLLSLKSKPGDIVLLRPQQSVDEKVCPAIAWENSTTGMKDGIVQLSKFLQEFYSIKLGEKIEITRSSEILREAGTVIVTSTSQLSDKERERWQGLLWGTIPQLHSILAPGMILKSPGKSRTQFDVIEVGGPLGRITDGTEFIIDRGGQDYNASELQLNFTGVGGLQSELKIIRSQIRLLFSKAIAAEWPDFPAKRGLLLYGAKGTGKTAVINALADNKWAKVLRWKPGVEASPTVYPQLIIIDLYDIKREVQQLLALFEAVKDTDTFVVGEIADPNNVDDRLRTIHTFSVELELPVPDADQRLDILQTLCKTARQPSHAQLIQMASRTHGYVGADLQKLLIRVWESAWDRHEERITTMNSLQNPKDTTSIQSTSNDLDTQNTEHDTALSQSQIVLSGSDIEASLAIIRPSALQQLIFEKPNVRWSDIGGQHDLKIQLIDAVNRTFDKDLRYLMSQLGVEVTKGVLLYGPPGCSKTLLAKALASEAEINFLAVKGAELISMYVGESERATREVFRKARAAAPSIIFFDEIDAIASRGSSRHGGGNDLNVLTTLLNEMDGIEELKNVIVVGATNKPQNIDAALLRPGRFDNVVYVGLPDVGTRQEIFEKRFRTVNLENIQSEDIHTFAVRTEGYSGAEIVAICKSAGELALKDRRSSITLNDVSKAIERAPRGVTTEMLREYEQWNTARSIHRQ